LGLGGQIYARPKDQEDGYTFAMTASLYANFRFDYTHNFIRFESKGPVDWLATVGYSGWKNLVYAGAGGQSVLLIRPEQEGENSAAMPFMWLAFSAPFGQKGWALTGQSSFTYAKTSANPDGLLDEIAPLGLGTSVYTDASIGVFFDEHDHWPLPNKGTQFEASLRAGLTSTSGRVHPMGSIQTQFIHWTPLWKDLFVLGLRFYGEADFGQRPFYQQDRSGLLWRDVLGEEQILVGYGKNRPRGNGIAAAALDLRFQYAHHHGKFWDIQAYLSLFAEEAWLWDGTDPGPHMPSVGVAPVVLFQHAIILRPFIAWGWRADSIDDPRRPVPQFGLRLLDPL